MEAKPEDMRRGQAVVHVLGCVLDKLVSASSPECTSSEMVTKFHSQKLPGISVREYLERIQKYAYCSTECFVLALIYIDRLIQSNNFTVTALNVHRVVITSVLLAAKFFDDQYFNNAHYAKVGGLPLSEMNALEVEFCFRINFSLHVADVVYLKYHTELANHAKTCGMCRMCVPSFPKLDPYRADASAATESPRNDWLAPVLTEAAGATHAMGPALRVEDIMAGPSHATTLPYYPGFVPVDHSGVFFKTGMPTGHPAKPHPMQTDQLAFKGAYPPVVDPCMSTWGVSAPVAAGPMYYPLFYS